MYIHMYICTYVHKRCMVKTLYIEREGGGGGGGGGGRGLGPGDVEDSLCHSEPYSEEEVGGWEEGNHSQQEREQHHSGTPLRVGRGRMYGVLVLAGSDVCVKSVKWTVIEAFSGHLKCLG